MIFLYILATIIFLIVFMLIRTRDKMYNYNQKKDYCYDLKNSKKFDISKAINLKAYDKNQTLILKLEIKSVYILKFFQIKRVKKLFLNILQKVLDI